MADVKVGFIGAGRRMQDFYMPVMAKHLKSFCTPRHNYHPIGFVTRTAKTAQQATEATGMKRYKNALELSKDVDMLIVCVNAQGMPDASMAALRTDVPVLLETPVTSQEVAQAAATRTIPTAVAEQWPMRPFEQFRRKCLDTGMWGKVNVVVNNFRGYEYHAMAMMRSYAGGARPHAVQGMSWSCGPVKLVNDRGETKVLDENWDVGTVILTNGVRLVHNFNSVHSRSRARGPRSLDVHCQRGMIGADDSVGGGNKHLQNFVWSDDEGRPVKPDVYIDNIVGNSPAVMSCKLNNKEVMWVNPYRVSTSGICMLDSQQVAIMEVLDGLVEDRPTYKVEEAFVDWVTVMLMRQSSQQGRVLQFPNLGV